MHIIQTQMISTKLTFKKKYITLTEMDWKHLTSSLRYIQSQKTLA